MSMPASCGSAQIVSSVGNVAPAQSKLGETCAATGQNQMAHRTISEPPTRMAMTLALGAGPAIRCSSYRCAGLARALSDNCYYRIYERTTPGVRQELPWCDPGDATRCGGWSVGSGRVGIVSENLSHCLTPGGPFEPAITPHRPISRGCHHPDAVLELCLQRWFQGCQATGELRQAIRPEAVDQVRCIQPTGLPIAHHIGVHDPCFVVPEHHSTQGQNSQDPGSAGEPANLQTIERLPAKHCHDCHDRT